MAGGPTPSQTLGPYFSMLLAHDASGEQMAGTDTPGQAILVAGRVLDGERAPIEDALVEVWQADAAGRYRHPLDTRDGTGPGFTGFGRSASRFEDGTWRVRTVKPGRVPMPDGALQAPHLNLCVQGRGMLNPVFTRVYFADEDSANTRDPVLANVPAARRPTMMAVRDDTSSDDVVTYRFDIRFQGDDETVFLDF